MRSVSGGRREARLESVRRDLLPSSYDLVDRARGRVTLGMVIGDARRRPVWGGPRRGAVDGPSTPGFGETPFTPTFPKRLP